MCAFQNAGKQRGMIRIKYFFNGVDEPVVSHEEPGAADHSSVEWDVLFDPILSVFRTES